MYKPSLEEFKKNAAQGNLIPVYKEIVADLDTPVSAYMKIRGGDYSFLLESVEGGEKWARYCFLGCDPSLVVRTKGNTFTIHNNGREETGQVDGGNPLSVIKKILSKYKPVPADGLPRFTGGAVGFIGYDMVRYFENLPDQTNDDLDVPDSLFVITDTLLIFDNVSHTIKIVSNAFNEGGDLDSLYLKTIEKIESLEKKLRASAPKISQGNGTQQAIEGSSKFESNFEKEAFKRAVLKIKKYIVEGDAIQVVLSQA